MNRRQAHINRPLAMLPGARPIYEDDPILNYRMPERIRVFFAYLAIAAITVCAVLVLSLPGN